MGAAPGLNASPNFTVETWFNWTGGGAAVNTGTGGVNALIPLVTKGGPENDTPANVNANYILGIMSGGVAAGRLVADFDRSGARTIPGGSVDGLEELLGASRRGECCDAHDADDGRQFHDSIPCDELIAEGGVFGGCLDFADRQG